MGGQRYRERPFNWDIASMIPHVLLYGAHLLLLVLYDHADSRTRCKILHFNPVGVLNQGGEVLIIRVLLFWLLWLSDLAEVLIKIRHLLESF